MSDKILRNDNSGCWTDEDGAVHCIEEYVAVGANGKAKIELKGSPETVQNVRDLLFSNALKRKISDG